MASLRGGTKVWNGDTVNQNNTSKFAVIGPGPYVAIYIESSVTGTFQIQVATSDAPEPGLNALGANGVNQDGGLVWHDYSGADALAVTGNVPIAFDLAPFSPQFVRIKRTDSGAASTITAWVSCFGPN